MPGIVYCIFSNGRVGRLIEFQCHSFVLLIVEEYFHDLMVGPEIQKQDQSVLPELPTTLRMRAEFARVSGRELMR